MEPILAALQTNASEVQAENNNISATARVLNMHRRTLQRKLAKRPVRQ